ncbi:MAG: hypothetical protein EAZ55_03025 [Cytophagales bacterium]|nr:MAG: hypothetical protein EAZ55_03025 [Cytophagales bacterium]
MTLALLLPNMALYISFSFLYWLHFIPSSSTPTLPTHAVWSDSLYFINKKANVLQNIDNCRNYDIFLRKLEGFDIGKHSFINIVHIGDSHIQADFFTAEVRSRLQQIYGNAGRGFFFPCGLANSNTPHNIHLSYTGTWNSCKTTQQSENCSTGLSGYVATTTDERASIKITINNINKNNHSIKIIKVYCDTRANNQFSIALLAAGIIYNPTIQHDEYWGFELPTSVQTFELFWKKQNTFQTEFSLLGISLESKQKGLFYHSVGQNGATFASVSRNASFSTHLQSLYPDIVIVSLGTNDAATKILNLAKIEESILLLLNKIRSVAPEAVIVLTTPNDTYYQQQSNTNIPKMVSIIKNIAYEQGCLVWDFYEVMGGRASIVEWQMYQLADKDRIHLSPKGYRLQGELFYEALQDIF